MECTTIKTKIGAKLSIRVIRKSGDAYIDLRGFTVESFIKSPLFGEYEMDVTHITETINGETVYGLTISMSSDDTEEITEGIYDWDVKLTNDIGESSIYPNDRRIKIHFLEAASFT